jgi:hypothetical protein
MINEPLLRKVVAELEHDLSKWDQANWVGYREPEKGNQPFPFVRTYTQPNIQLQDCGTTFCIAGMTCLINGDLDTEEGQVAVGKWDPFSGVFFSQSARKALGLSQNQAAQIFGFMNVFDQNTGESRRPTWNEMLDKITEVTGVEFDRFHAEATS